MIRAAARLGLLAAVAVSAAYLVQVPQSMPLGGPAAALEGFHATEGDFRWTTGRAALHFRDPGPRARFRLELEVSAWRPRGSPPVRVALAAGGEVREGRVTARPQTLSLPVAAAGWWRSDVTAVLTSETFRPGRSDARLLGVRVHRARLVPLEGVVGLRRPPLGQVVAAGLATVLLHLSLVGLGVGRAAAARAGGAVAPALLLAFVLARPWAAALSWPAALAAAVAATLAWGAPGAVRAFAGLVAATGLALARGARTLRGWPTLVVAAIGVVSVAAVHRAHPRIDIDLGSGEEAAVARRFGPSDGEAGVSFRTPLRGAEIDLRDFGGGAPWMIRVTAASSAARPRLVLARAGGAELAAPVEERWSTAAFRAPVPWAWRSGLQVSIPAAGEAGGARFDRVEVFREGGLPSPNLVACVVASALLIVVAAGAVGLPAPIGHVAGGLLALAQAAALGETAVAAIPFAPTFAAICALGALLAAALAAASRRRAPDAPALPPAVLFVAAAGFVAWVTAAAFPLYRGGHFVFHSQIAEEIWRGRFLIFYLPYPGSILSRQEQWGNIIVPHPCLYHTLVSPLAALGRPAFHFVEKALLALGLVTMLLVSAGLARRIDGERAAVWAAVVFATLAPTYQILGLGHLMMLFGVWAATVALGFIALRFEALPRPRTWLPAVLLLTLCFLSYTASLLFTSVVLAIAAALLLRRAPEPARALACAVVAAATLAFGLYYVNWAWPFLSESLPRIASSAPGGGSGETWPRLAQQPAKLAYTYGSALVPVLGLGGLFLARRAEVHLRVLLLSWASILLLVGAGDLFFNFLRKHHYFVMAPVAVGAGVLLARLGARAGWGRVAATVLGLAAGALGLRTAVDAAVGRIP